ncbi:MAG: isoprenoid biosynthesis glyoxalase ElbB [Candidatus Aminicenantes bacterium]|nr:MAG: isoprenoid biosynthesis glyoxalase ElbB [Candidatus Aminicenantes bacterium]
MKKVAVVLSGAGVFDGAEIHESVITLLALDRQGVEVQIFAPNIPQMHVVNHLSQQPADETRNVLVEAARIARSKIKDLAQANINDFDAVIFPGGYGAAKNLCDFAVKGPDCKVNPVVEQFVADGLKAGKVMGFICIAPALCARIAANTGVHPTLTIGTDKNAAAAVESLGARHINCPVNDIVVDEQNKIVTTPAYMLGQRISEVADGIEKLVSKVLEMV